MHEIVEEYIKIEVLTMLIKNKFTDEQQAMIRKLSDSVISAKSKKEARVYLDELICFKDNLELEPPARNILGELINDLKNVSGKSINKEHWIICAEQTLYRLKSFC